MWLVFFPLATAIVVFIYAELSFKANCTDWLSSAANASTVMIAHDRLSVALSYLEKRNLNSGSTHIIYYSPVNDVSLWYKNIKSSQTELSLLIEHDDELSVGQDKHLRESNVLMKLREVLLDNGEIVKPPNIALYPHIVSYYVLGTLSVILGGFGIFLYMQKSI